MHTTGTARLFVDVPCLAVRFRPTPDSDAEAHWWAVKKPRRLPGAVDVRVTGMSVARQVFAVLRRAHFVKQVGDFELGFGFRLGSKFLD